jgi:hypothetical protein
MMRLMLIVCSFVLLCSSAGSAQRIQSDSLTTVALQPSVTDSTVVSAPVTFRITYPVMRHSLYGTAGGAAIAGTLFGVFSVLCSSPSCPPMGKAITYGVAFGALTGAAVGAVSGSNTPVREPTAQRAGNEL